MLKNTFLNLSDELTSGGTIAPGVEDKTILVVPGSVTDPNGQGSKGFEDVKFRENSPGGGA